MNVTADYVDKVAKGIIPPVITTEYKGQYNIIKNNLNNMVKMMSDLLAQTDIIIRGAAAEGTANSTSAPTPISSSVAGTSSSRASMKRSPTSSIQ
jgi:hypothetical protein